MLFKIRDKEYAFVCIAESVRFLNQIFISLVNNNEALDQLPVNNVPVPNS